MEWFQHKTLKNHILHPSESLFKFLVLFTRATRYTEALAVANQLHAVLVHPHQTDWVHIGENATVESAGSHLAGKNQLNSDPIHIFCADISNTDCWPFHPCWQCCSCTRLLRRTRQSVPPQNVLWMPPTHWGATRFPLPAELCGLFLLVELAETGGSGRFPRYIAPPTVREQSCYCSSSWSKLIFYSYWFCKIVHFWKFSKHKHLQCSCA